MERKHPRRGRGNIVGITVLVVALIAVAAVAGVLFGGSMVKTASYYRGSLSMDTSIKANDKWAVGVVGFGVSGDGTTMSAELGGLRISGTIDSTFEADGDVVYRLSVVSGSNSFFGMSLESPEASFLVPKGAAKDRPFGRWGFGLKGTVHNKIGSYPRVQSVVLTYDEDGTGKLDSVKGYGVAGKNEGMDSCERADVLSGSYDPIGEAGKAAVAAKRGEASGGDFTWEYTDRDCKVTWPPRTPTSATRTPTCARWAGRRPGS